MAQVILSLVFSLPILGTASLIPINNECQFQGNLYQLRKAKSSKPNYYLLIQRSERTMPTAGSRGSSTSKSNFQITSYAIMPLNNPDQSLNYGDFEIPLYPVPVLNPPAADPLPETIVFTVADLRPDSHSGRPGSLGNPIVPKRTNLSGMATIQENKDDSVKDLVLDNIQPHPGEEVSKSDSIAIYIDSMRFIPNTCGVIKVNLKGYTTNMECNITEKQMTPKRTTMLPLLESTVIMPVYNQKRLIKVNNLSPSTIIIGTLEMFDTYLGKDAILGYFIINLFVERSSGAPARTASGEKNLNVGKFQLPIFCEGPMPKPFALEKL